MDNKVTFTSIVKEEICSLEFERWQLLSLLAGFVKVNGVLTLSRSGMALTLKTENSKIAKKIYQAFKVLFDVNPSSSYSRKMKLDKGVVYGISVEEKTISILEELQLMKDGEFCFPHEIVLEEKLRFFIAGAFLASGTVNSPNSKNYHLQFVIPNEDDAKYFLKLLHRFRNDRAMDFKVLQRGNKYVLYLKKADQIATFLSIVYAHVSFFEFENIRIEKDYLNSDNRLQICYTANYQKTVAKGEEQAREIQYIFNNGGAELLTEKERAVAELRLNNVDMSLTQISQTLLEQNVVLSRSGVNHVLEKLHKKFLEMKANG